MTGAAVTAAGGDQFAVFPALLSRRPVGHADAEQESLLYDEHQNGRDKEGGKPLLGIKQNHFFVFHRVCYEGGFLISSDSSPFHLNVLVHFERHLGGSHKYAFVVEHTAHVAEETDVALTVVDNVVGEVGGYLQIAIGALLLNLLTGVGGIGGETDHADPLRGVEPTDKLSRQTAVAVVNHCNGYLARQFRRINV